MDQTLWLLVIVVSGAAMLSPGMADCPYNVKACKCTDRSVICTNLDSIPPLVSKNIDGNITTLIFTSGKWNSIPANSLPANLQTINLANVNITSISPDAFSNSSTTLRSFSMSKVIYPELPEALLKVDSLTDLKLSDTNIKNWNTTVLEHVGNTVRSVTFENVGLTSWPEWLKNFTLVNSVDLSRNEITNVSIDAFNNLHNLTSLLLRSAELEEADNLVLALSPVSHTLETLDVSDGVFSYIPKGLATLTKLSKFNASSSLLSDITPDAIPPQLKVLDLSHNAIKYVNYTAFPNQSSLETLILSINDIHTISTEAFRSLTNLRVLNLDASGLYGIPIALTSLTNLEVLNLDRLSQLKCPCPRDEKLLSWFKSMKKLSVSGRCSNNNYDVQEYLSSEKVTCTGFKHLSGSVFLYVLAILVAKLCLV